MTTATAPGKRRALLEWTAVAVAYLALAVALTWPLVAHMGDAIPGIAQVDLFDTVWLRLATAKMFLEGTYPLTHEVFAPAGYPLGDLLPNSFDHLLAAPFVLLLPWPLADNLFWIALLAANGLAAHRLGRQEGGTHAAGFLVGVLFASSDAILREANLGRSPEAMLFATPMYVAAILRVLREDGRPRDAIAAGVWMALAGLGYWYQALFHVIVSIPLGIPLLRAPWRRAGLARVALAAFVAITFVAVPLSIILARRDDMPDPTQASFPAALHLTPRDLAIPEDARWPFGQGSDALWPLRPTPLDRSNRLSIVLLGTAFLGSRARRDDGVLRVWVLAAMFLIPAVMILGPYVKIGDVPPLVAGGPIALPARWLALVSSTFDRLSWPQRWGSTALLPLLLLAARSPAAGRWAAIGLLEALLLSGNAPLALTDIRPFSGWRSLEGAPGAVLVLPLNRQGQKGPTIGLIYREIGGPVGAVVEIPPGAGAPVAWDEWQRQCRFCEWFAHVSPDEHPPLALDPDAVRDLRRQKIAAIAVDATPGGVMMASRARRLRRELDAAIGPSVDVGSAYVWWLAPGAPPKPMKNADAWRKQVLSGTPLSGHHPPSRTIVRPVGWAL